MIINTRIYFTISGKKLNPNEIEKELDIVFSEVELKGEKYSKGRFKEQLVETSSATIASNSEEYNQDDEEIYRLATLAVKINENAKKYNIEDSSFHIYFYYAAQCKLSFDKQVLSVLAKLDFVNIDCIQLYDKYETKQISDDQELVKFYSNEKLEKEVTLKNVYLKPGS